LPSREHSPSQLEIWAETENFNCLHPHTAYPVHGEEIKVAFFTQRGCKAPSPREGSRGWGAYRSEAHHADREAADQRQPHVGAGDHREEEHVECIAKLARDQHGNGTNFIDVNAGVFVGQEPELLKWLVATVQGAMDAPCCIDSPDPRAIVTALVLHKGVAMINSISLEKERYEKLLPVVAEFKSKVVALCMSDESIL
jgi:hypothetical protein